MRDVGVPFWNRLSKPGNYKWKLLWKIWKVWKCVRSLSVGKTMFPMALQTQPSPLAVSSNSQTMFSWSISTRRNHRKMFWFLLILVALFIDIKPDFLRLRSLYFAQLAFTLNFGTCTTELQRLDIDFGSSQGEGDSRCQVSWNIPKDSQVRSP